MRCLLECDLDCCPGMVVEIVGTEVGGFEAVLLCGSAVSDSCHLD